MKDYLPTNIIDKRLIELGIQLPEPTPTEFNYIPLSIHNEIVHLAGQIPKINTTEIRHIGRVGEGVETEDAREDAGLCVLHGLSWLKHELNSLDQIKKILRLNVYIAISPDFDKYSQVADGASEMLVKIFGAPIGQHPRSVIAVSRLPRNAPVMIDMVIGLNQ